MFGFPKRGQRDVQVDFVHADGTPIVPTSAAIASIDAQLRAITEVPAPARTEEQWDYIDRLLDARMGHQLVRSAVPVIPGGEGGSR